MKDAPSPENDFGNFVKALREQRLSYWLPWTQEYLAHRAGLPTDLIARIEQGRTKKLYEHLEKLAIAFGLNELQKVEFYARAGYNYQPRSGDEDKDEIYQWLEQLPFPASARTPLWDFLAFNSYHEVLWGYTPEVIERLNTGNGPNLLRVLFDEELNKMQTAQLDEEGLQLAVALFRTDSFRFITLDRYREIVSHMTEVYPAFENAWREVDRRTPDTNILRRPLKKLVHPHLGEIELMSLRIPPKYLRQNADISVYVPVSAQKYEVLSDYVMKHVAQTSKPLHIFRDQPLV